MNTDKILNISINACNIYNDPQPTTFDHIIVKYIWGPHVNHMGPHVDNALRFGESVHIK